MKVICALLATNNDKFHVCKRFPTVHREMPVHVHVCVIITFLVDTPEDRKINEKFSNIHPMKLPWLCEFGVRYNLSFCGFRQDKNDDADWDLNFGATDTHYTGPPQSEQEEHGV